MRVSGRQDDLQIASILPQLAVRDGLAAVRFYAAAFGAKVVYQVGGTEDNKALVAQLAIGSASFWVSDEAPEHGNYSPESLGGATTRMLLIVANPRAVLQQAVVAGAKLARPPVKEHDWLLGRIEDPFGHHWEIGRPLIPWPPVSGRHHAG